MWTHRPSRGSRLYELSRDGRGRQLTELDESELEDESLTLTLLRPPVAFLVLSLFASCLSIPLFDEELEVDELQETTDTSAESGWDAFVLAASPAACCSGVSSGVY